MEIELPDKSNTTNNNDNINRKDELSKEELDFITFKADLEQLSEIQLKNKVRMLESDIGNSKSEISRYRREMKNLEFREKDTKEKIKLNTQLPHLISTISEMESAMDRLFAMASFKASIMPCSSTPN